jgi:hypothetical protein
MHGISAMKERWRQAEGKHTTLTQQVSNPPGKEARPVSAPLPQPQGRGRFPTAGVVSLLALVGLLILSSSGFLLVSFVQTLSTYAATQKTPGTPLANHRRRATSTASATANQGATPTANSPLFTPNNTTVPPLQLSPGYSVIYEQQNSLYLVSSTASAGGSSGTPQLILSPGYIYNEAVHPILTPTGQLLYSGDGIWLTDVFGGDPEQLATIAPDVVITSMAISDDGSMVAWSTEPVNGDGVIDIYAASLSASLSATGKVFEQLATGCPCFRIFGFMHGIGKQADNTLLLTDGQQSHEAIQLGLWTLDLSNPQHTATPRILLDEASQQGPLVMAPNENVLLYSSYEGQVPVPTDNSVPSGLATITYPNSLDVAALNGNPLSVTGSQVALPEQHELSNSADYHWVTTPIFTWDGHTLIYVEFSNEIQAPFDRSSAIFMVQISGSGKSLHVSKPQLLATSNALLVELGTWLNSHTMTLYADGTLYAWDIHSGAVAPIVQTGTYARIIAVVGSGNL